MAFGSLAMPDMGKWVIPSHDISYPIDSIGINIWDNHGYDMHHHSLMRSVHGLARAGIGAPPSGGAGSRGPTAAPRGLKLGYRYGKLGREH